MKNLVMLSACALSVAACATPYAPIPYDREMANITQVVVIEDAMPDTATTQKLATNGQNMASAMAASAGLAGVLVGAIASGIEAGIEAGQRARILATLEAEGFDGEAIFDEALDMALAENGYEVGTLAVEHASDRKLIDLEPNPDAAVGSGVLDVAGAGYGYQLVGGNTQWRPFVNVTVRLTDPADPKHVLLENRVVYNPVATPDVILNIPPEEEFAFAKIEDIEANPEKAAEGLRLALVATANGVASLLR